MDKFIKSNMLPIIATALVSLLGFLTYETIHNASRIDALSLDLKDIKLSLQEIVKIMLKDK